jgi:transcriptional regulator with XRE-family HTH domain
MEKAAASLGPVNDGPDEMNSSVGERLREARRAAGLNQREAAAELGVTRRSIYEWETDVRLPHSALPALAVLYGTSVTQLLYGVDPASEELVALRTEVGVLAQLVVDLAAATEAGFAELRRLVEELLRGDDS